MKRTIFVKFILLYLFIGCLGFLVTSTLGSHLTEQLLVKNLSEDLYREVNTVASNSTLRYSTSDSNLESIYNSLSALAQYQNTEIWMLDKEGTILINTSYDYHEQSEETIGGFDPIKWGESYYRTGDFYGHFSQPMMSVMAPITAYMNVKGYVAIHYPMSELYSERESILWIIHMMYFVLLLLTLSLLVFFTHSIYRPLEKITKGANEFSSGNLDYEIPVHTHDEMGYLAASLNYMSDELNITGEFQKKFVANISHDFRSPLTSIKGYLEAIEDGTIPPEMQNKYINIVLSETARLEKLTQSILTLNDLNMKTRMLNLRVFDINKVIKNTAAVFGGTCRNRMISIELILSGEQLYVYADMEQIQQVLYNLLDNAIKFSPDHSEVTIETTEKNGKVFVSVKDRGTGIPKESLPKIWDRFYKEDASRGKDRKGTGLGLSIVKEIIHAHNQNINVISTEGVGTEFLFTLEQAD